MADLLCPPCSFFSCKDNTLINNNNNNNNVRKRTPDKCSTVLIVYFLCLRKCFVGVYISVCANATTGNFAYFCTNPSPAEHFYVLLFRSAVQQLYLFLGSCEYTRRR